MDPKGRRAAATDRAPSPSPTGDRPQPKVAATTGRKIGTPEVEKRAVKAEPPRPKAAAAVAAPHPLNEALISLLRKIATTDGPGFLPSRKPDLAGVDLLLHNRLIKRGPKDRTSGKFHYRPTKGGSVFLESC